MGVMVNNETGLHPGAPGALATEPGLRRRERQARVGLLRNPNHKPPPPPRCPPLIGRNLVLRSTRRAPPRSGQPAEDAEGPPLVLQDQGRIARIDIDRLARIAEELRPSGKAGGTAAPARARRDPLGPAEAPDIGDGRVQGRGAEGPDAGTATPGAGAMADGLGADAGAVRSARLSPGVRGILGKWWARLAWRRHQG